MILAGDVGGTKTVLALCEAVADRPRERVRATFASGEFGSLSQVLERFLRQNGGPPLEAVCLAVAGPVIGGRVTTTNLPWAAIDAAALGQALGAPVTLLNDLQAAAFGMLDLPAESCVALNPDAGPPQPGNVAVIAAGTGLGEAFLVWDGERHLPVATEGGHGAFAPADPEQDALLEFLRGEVGGRVSWERVLSGPGLASLYRFARARSREPEPEWLAARLASEDAGAVVTDEGLSGRDAACARALALFVSLYAAEAGDLALRTLAIGGVFLGGGIAPRILPLLQDGAFLRAFVDKGRFEPLLRRVPVTLALDPAVPLLGAARWIAGPFGAA